MRSLILSTALIAMLGMSLDGRADITPDQAVSAVRSFVGSPFRPLRVVAKRPSPGWPYSDHYLLFSETYPNPDECYEVDAVTGQVLMASFGPGTEARGSANVSHAGERPPEARILLAQARAVAEAYVRDHYPPARQGHWLPEEYRAGPDYLFGWTPILNERFQTRAPWEVVAQVNGVNGKVYTFSCPVLQPILSPVVPTISKQRAVAIAAPFARYDPQQVPFDEVYLKLELDEVGVQRLEWHLLQHPNPQERGYYFGVAVDALTGEPLGVGGPLGGGGGKPRERLAIVPPRIAIRARVARSPVGCVVRPRLEGGALWVRAEELRGLGAVVEPGATTVTVSAGGKSLTGAELGAFQRDLGWWVPLRKTCQALGWRVEWHPDRHEAVVDAPGPTTAGTSGPLSQ